MKRLFATSVLTVVGFAIAPAHAVVYCKTVGVPKGCVARPVAAPGVGAPGVGVVEPGINQPGAAGNVGVPGASPTNLNGGANRVGVRR